MNLRSEIGQALRHFGHSVSSATKASDGRGLRAGGDEAKRAFKAMMSMKKIDVATIAALLLSRWRGLADVRFSPCSVRTKAI